MPIMAGADAHGPDTLLQTAHANSLNPLAVRGRAIHSVHTCRYYGPRFTISLKRSTQNLSPIHNAPADYPIFWPFLPFAALRRDVGSVMESGPNAHIAASRSLTQCMVRPCVARRF
jgi:hypothetical protein